jgi:hypothetical protein
VRDDLKSLPLPPEAKAYARRTGLSAMKKQPQSFINMVAAITGQKNKKHGFKNTDEVGTVPKAVNESARALVTLLTETDNDPEYHEFNVRKFSEHPDFKGKIIYNIDVADPIGMHNYLTVDANLPESEQIKLVEERLRLLAKTRNYPDGSFFVAPWGMYLIHGGTIGRF